MIDKSQVEIFVPTLNEEGNIKKTIRGIKSNGFNNITILDGNSSDRTKEFAESLGCKINLEFEKKNQSFEVQSFQQLTKQNLSIVVFLMVTDHLIHQV